MRTAAKPVCLLVALCASLALTSVASAQDFPDQSRFQKVTLNDRPGEPMSLAVLPDGRVLHAARTGEIRLHNPRTGTNNIVTDMKQAPQGLYQHDEEGVQGIAVDPNFEENDWVYVYYSPRLNTPVDNPATPGVNEGDAPATSTDPTVWEKFKGYNQLSRFKFVEEPTPHIDLASEQQIIRVDVDRGICCHVAGKVGTGFTRVTLRDLAARLEPLRRETSSFADEVRARGATWVEPRLVAQIGFSEWTRDGRLRHPRFLGLRDDRAAGEVVREASA